MKKRFILSASCLLFVFLILCASTIGFAQIREDLRKPSDYTGPVIKENPSEGSNLGNLFNMTMDHSYSMMFSSFGGQAHNINAYTNTMHFFFSEDLTGRVDLSILHSPFGYNLMSPNSNNSMGTDFVIQNAELNYQISDNSSVSLRFQQLPTYGMNPWSRGYNNSPFNSPFQGSNF